jgi:hypothetical protein
MEQSPSETEFRSAGQEIPRLLWNPNLRYRVDKSGLCSEPDESSSHDHIILF